MVSAGPTHEAIDPVRYIGNHSSGLMGFAIAEEFAERGGEVILVSGPSALTTANESIHRIDVQSAEQMHQECIKHAAESDIIVMTAAVADYTPEVVASEKIKKGDKEISIKLKKTPDILAEIGANKNDNQFIVGFALETENQIANAEKKLERKNLDLIVLNSPRDEGAAFGVETNKVTMISRNKERFEYELKLKFDVAIDIVNKIRELSF
jgi:phosphopantothenoylcysteine decarboxylase/phosphopantothenate--cysteine ligase